MKLCFGVILRIKPVQEVLYVCLPLIVYNEKFVHVSEVPTMFKFRRMS